MAELFHKTFVDAATGANGFDAVGASNGTVVHSAGAGLNGTSGGITFTRTGNSPNLYGEVSIDLSAASVFRSAWWLDMSAVTISTDTHNTRLYTMEATGASPARASLVMIINRSAVLNFEHYFYRDNGTSVFNTVPLDGFPDWMELRVQRASDGSTANGEAQLYAGGGDYAALGELISEHTGILHYTQFEKPIHRAGMRLSSSSVAGALLFDEWTVRDDDTPILYGVSASISTAKRYIAAIRNSQMMREIRRGITKARRR